MSATRRRSTNPRRGTLFWTSWRRFLNAKRLHCAVTKLASLFVNHEQKRLRAPWRLSLQIVGFFLVMMLARGFATHMPNRASFELVQSLLYLSGGLALTFAISRFIDKRRFADYGFHVDADWWIDLCFGLALGAILVIGAVMTMLSSVWIVLNNVSITNLGVPFAVALAIKVISMAAVGVNEELTFRGYQLRNLAEGLTCFGPRMAIGLAMLLSSIIFGLLHLINELAGGAWTSPLATLNLILGGCMLSLPYLLTGELAISIGLHITWNLFQGTIYGLPVSGNAPHTHLLSVVETGPD